MGRSQVPYFAYAADDQSPVVVVTLVDWSYRDKVIATLLRDQRMVPGSVIVDHPKLPAGPEHRWRLRDGQMVEDASVPDPAPHDRLGLKDTIDSATSIAQLKPILRKLAGLQ